MREAVARDSQHRCGYCLTPQRYTGIQLVQDHIIPESRGGKTVRENLWLACRRCNEHKHTRIDGFDLATQKTVSLFNPRTQTWALHFVWDETGTKILGVSATGRVTVDTLDMNNGVVVEARRFWVIAGWHPAES